VNALIELVGDADIDLEGETDCDEDEIINRAGLEPAALLFVGDNAATAAETAAEAARAVFLILTLGGLISFVDVCG